MSESEVESHSDLQPEDDTTTRASIAGVLEDRIEEHLREQQLEREAYVRKLITVIEEAIVEGDQERVDEALAELHWSLRGDDRVRDLLDPRDDALKDVEKVRYQQYAVDRARYREGLEAGEDVERPTIPRLQEFSVYVEIAKALGIVGSYYDKTQYAPVRFEILDQQGVASRVEPGQQTPVGRRRIGSGTAADPEDYAVEIPHADAEHILIVADPRQGKDSTGVRLCGNLKDEHGYKWVSLFDDGRNETPAISIPNDERAIRENLAEFDQEPKGYTANVWVPAVGAPDELPGNHEVFTIGLESLTPGLIGQLAGVPPQGSSSRRIKAALDETRAGRGSVEQLIDKLEELAEETSAQITVTELKDEDEVDDEADIESYQTSYEMGEDEYLKECAQTLLMLYSEGLLRDEGAETNLDLREILLDQESVAVLNCNYLPPGQRYLKFLLVNLWARLIFELGSDPNTPRVAIEAREIKKLAPSKIGDHPFPDQARRLKQTIFDIASQGGSRRILMVGSTQYINDVYKPVRGNMPLKILLSMGDEKINTLEGAGYHFTPEQREYLQRRFDQGWGMFLGHEGKIYPIQWCGARCGLGLGDLDFRTRYGWAQGYRVHRSDHGRPRWEHDAEVYVDVDGELQEAPPDRDEWYLLLEDLPGSSLEAAGEVLSDEDQGLGAVDEERLEAALEERREYPLPRDLRPEGTPSIDEQRELRLISSDKAAVRRQEEIRERYDLQGVLAEWVELDRERLERCLEILRTVADYEISKYGDIKDLTDIPTSTIGYDMTGPLERCVDRGADPFEIEPVGEAALNKPWSRILEDLDEE